MVKRLTPAFFDRPTLIVAEELLGCFLCRKLGKEIVRMEITEVEAYYGFEDRASHAHRGQTARNAPMFGEAGRWYVYFTYGMHWMLNIVTGPAGYPAAVLIRGTKEVSGPARLTRFLKIDKRFNDKKAAVQTGLWIEARPPMMRKGKPVRLKIKRTPRIGVAYAGARWGNKPYRFTMSKASAMTGCGHDMPAATRLAQFRMRR